MMRMAKAAKELRAKMMMKVEKVEKVKSTIEEHAPDMITQVKKEGFNQIVGAFSAKAEGKSLPKSSAMLGDNNDIPAIPYLASPDTFGFADAENTDKLNEAGWLDCNPIQNGLSKMMCDLYCTEQAVKEGDRTIIQNIQTSHTILMTNIERLLDYHTQTLMWGLGQLGDVGNGLLTSAGGNQGDDE